VLIVERVHFGVEGYTWFSLSLNDFICLEVERPSVMCGRYGVIVDNGFPVNVRLIATHTEMLKLAGT
jgi:hypothetical protein